MKLTEHFTLEELTRSTTATLRHLDNTPSIAHVHNLCALAVLILEPLRVEFGRPLIITSGFRSIAVNNAVGGVSNSYHLLGQAADIRCTPADGLRLCDILAKNPYLDKALFEHSSSGQWLHVQISSAPRQYINRFYVV